jgi:hypothetical protein
VSNLVQVTSFERELLVPTGVLHAVLPLYGPHPHSAAGTDRRLIWLCVCVSVHMCTHLHVHVYVHVYVHVHVPVCVYMYRYACVCTCVRVWVHAARYHVYALVVVLLVGLRMGMTVVIQAKFDLVQVRCRDGAFSVGAASLG